VTLAPPPNDRNFRLRLDPDFDFDILFVRRFHPSQFTR
jgi:hypothetical protein